MTFTDQVQFAKTHQCYSEDLALMTPANKKTLIEFVGFAKAPTGAQANFSNALAEAFRLLANSEAGDDMQPGDVRRGL